MCTHCSTVYRPDGKPRACVRVREDEELARVVAEDKARGHPGYPMISRPPPSPEELRQIELWTAEAEAHDSVKLTAATLFLSQGPTYTDQTHYIQCNCVSTNRMN